MMLYVLGDIAAKVSTKVVRRNISFLKSADLGSQISRLNAGPSASTVANHLGAVATVVQVGAILEHARVTVRLTATPAAAEWV